MTMAMEIRGGIRAIGVALRRPEELAQRWQKRRSEPGPHPVVFAILLVNAIAGLAAYGLTAGVKTGPGAMLLQAAVLPIACGLAWTVALPALYIINSALGSKLDASTTTLAALVTVSFGSLAMLASVPVAWFFTVAIPYNINGALPVNILVFLGVGVCMSDVFLRIMQALEPERGRIYPLLWLCLVATIGLELMNMLHVGPFTAFPSFYP